VQPVGVRQTQRGLAPAPAAARPELGRRWFRRQRGRPGCGVGVIPSLTAGWLRAIEQRGARRVGSAAGEVRSRHRCWPPIAAARRDSAPCRAGSSPAPARAGFATTPGRRGNCRSRDGPTLFATPPPSSQSSAPPAFQPPRMPLGYLDRTESPSDSGPFGELGQARLRRGKKVLHLRAISGERPFRPSLRGQLARERGTVAHSQLLSG